MTDTRKDLKKTPIKLDVKRAPKPQLSNAYLAKLPKVLHEGFITPCLDLEKDHKTSACLAGSCLQLNSIYQPALTKQHRQLRCGAQTIGHALKIV